MESHDHSHPEGTRHIEEDGCYYANPELTKGRLSVVHSYHEQAFTSLYLYSHRYINISTD